MGISPLLSLIIPPEEEVEKGGQGDDQCEAEGVLADGDDVMTDDGFKGGGWEFADEGRQEVFPEGHGRERAKGVQYDGGKVRDEPGEEHDSVAFSAANLGETFQSFMTADKAESCSTEKGAEQDEAHGDAYRFRRPREENARDEAKDQCVGRGEENGRRESEGIHEGCEEEAEVPRFVPVGEDERGNFIHIAAGQHEPEIREEIRGYLVNDSKEEDQKSTNGRFKKYGSWIHGKTSGIRR